MIQNIFLSLRKLTLYPRISSKNILQPSSTLLYYLTTDVHDPLQKGFYHLVMLTSSTHPDQMELGIPRNSLEYSLEKPRIFLGNPSYISLELINSQCFFAHTTHVLIKEVSRKLLFPFHCWLMIWSKQNDVKNL